MSTRATDPPVSLARRAAASWNDVILGIIVFVLAIASARASEEAALAEVREDSR
jgi:SPW repeat-containing protein